MAESGGGEKVWDLVVIGGGPAGMLTAILAAEALVAVHGSVLLLEKQAQLGRKLLLTGSGRCNISNGGQASDVVAGTEREPVALRAARAMSARYGEYPESEAARRDPLAELEPARGLLTLLAAHTPAQVRRLLGPGGQLGIELVEQELGRLFPASDSAREVLEALQTGLDQAGVTVCTGIRVDGIVAELAENRIGAVHLADDRMIRGKRFVLATGGSNYPKTGSTGDALPWLRALGLPVLEPWPALVGIRVGEAWVSRLAGLGLERVGLSLWTEPVQMEGGGQARRCGKVTSGPLIFTHGGLSGPVILHRSAMIIRLRRLLPKSERLLLRIDLVPDQAEAALLDWLNAAALAHPHRQVENAIATLLSQVGAEIICQTLVGLKPDARLGQLPKAERRRLVAVLKGMTFSYTGNDGWDKAISTAGGLSPRELDWRTMSCRHWPNLHVIGDVVSLDRPSGGYSLLVCWASAMAVAAALDSKETNLT